MIILGELWSRHQLTARHRHEAYHRWLGSADIEIVPLGFNLHGINNSLTQYRVVSLATQQRHQVDLIVLPQAQVKFTLAGNSHPIAGFAEIMAVR